MGTGAERKGKWQYCVMGTVSVWDDGKILGLDSGDGCPTL